MDEGRSPLDDDEDEKSLVECLTGKVDGFGLLTCLWVLANELLRIKSLSAKLDCWLACGEDPSS